MWQKSYWHAGPRGVSLCLWMIFCLRTEQSPPAAKISLVQCLAVLKSQLLKEDDFFIITIVNSENFSKDII